MVDSDFAFETNNAFSFEFEGRAYYIRVTTKEIYDSDYIRVYQSNLLRKLREYLKLIGL